MVLMICTALTILAMAPSEGAPGHPPTMLMVLLVVLVLVLLSEHGLAQSAGEANLGGLGAGRGAHDHVVAVLIVDHDVSGLWAGAWAGRTWRLRCPEGRCRHVDREKIARVHIKDFDDWGPAIKTTRLLS